MLGRLDVLFNVRLHQKRSMPLLILLSLRLSQNAGTTAPQVPIEDTSLETFLNTINVNLVGTFLCTREAVKIFKSQTPQGGAPPPPRLDRLTTLSGHPPNARLRFRSHH